MLAPAECKRLNLPIDEKCEDVHTASDQQKRSYGFGRSFADFEEKLGLNAPENRFSEIMTASLLILLILLFPKKRGRVVTGSTRW